MNEPRDPFRERRCEDGVLEDEFRGEPVAMILRHRDVREAAKDWRTFSSDAPFRVPVPSEEHLRTVRQLPIERDPPEHTDYRKIVEPFFKRAKDPEVAAEVEALVVAQLDDALSRESVEVVREFALPLQSRALAVLLDVPQDEAETWIGWGVHVFHDGASGEENGTMLDRYLQARFDQAEESPGDDFFSALTRATFQGRPLSRDEMVGFANLAFAGGRDTIIHTVSSIVGYFARHPERLEWLREEPKRIVNASEEFFRVVTPLTHIGRVCPADTDVSGATVEAGHRASLCWASANFDEEAFDAPEEVRLDRKPNPHMAFGAGIHICLGAPHARLITRCLLQQLCARVGGINLLEAVPHVEESAHYRREIGYDSLVVQLQLAGSRDAG